MPEQKILAILSPSFPQILKDLPCPYPLQYALRFLTMAKRHVRRPWRLYKDIGPSGWVQDLRPLA